MPSKRAFGVMRFLKPIGRDFQNEPCVIAFFEFFPSLSFICFTDVAAP